MSKITVRPANLGDIPRVIEVCNVAWRGIWTGQEEMFRDRIITFPALGIAVAEINGVIEGYISVQLMERAEILRAKSWNEATDSGSIGSTHDPAGNWIHGVGLALTVQGSKAGVAQRLISYTGQYAVSHHKCGALFVTRIPGYYKHQEEMQPEEYVTRKNKGKSIDPELRLWQRYGFEVVRPPVVLHDYVEGGGDPHSCGFGALVEWLNPFYGRPFPWLWRFSLKASSLTG